MTEILDPPEIEHGFVIGRFVKALADSLQDTDRYPDLRPVTGRIQFRPRQVVHLYGGTHPTTVVKKPIFVNVDSQGWLVDETAENQASASRGVYLAVGQYEVRPEFPNASEVSSFIIEVTSEHTEEQPLDLTLAAPIQPPPGYIKVVTDEDRIRAESAAINASLAADVAGSASEDAVAARDVAVASASAAEGYAETASGIISRVDVAEEQLPLASQYAGEAQTSAATASAAATSAEASATSATASAESADTNRGEIQNIIDEFLDDGLPLATPSSNGLMRSEDKAKLDSSSAVLPTAGQRGLVERDNNNRFQVNDPNSDLQAVNKRFVDNNFTPYGALPNGQDINLWFQIGNWTCNSSDVLVENGYPRDMSHCSLEVRAFGSNGAWRIQTIKSWSGNRTFIRRGNQADGGGWSEWSEVVFHNDLDSAVSTLKASNENYTDDKFAGAFAKPLGIADGNVNNITEHGVYQIADGPVTTANGFPVNTVGGVVLVYPAGIASRLIQMFIQRDAQNTTWSRASSNSGDSWGSWTRQLQSSDLDDIVQNNLGTRINGEWVKYDSGWRDISSTLVSQTTSASYLHIRRTLDLVHLRGDIQRTSGMSNLTFVANLASASDSWHPLELSDAGHGPTFSSRIQRQQHDFAFSLLGGAAYLMYQGSWVNGSFNTTGLAETRGIFSTTFTPKNPAIPSTLIGTAA